MAWGAPGAPPGGAVVEIVQDRAMFRADEFFEFAVELLRCDPEHGFDGIDRLQAVAILI